MIMSGSVLPERSTSGAGGSCGSGCCGGSSGTCVVGGTAGGAGGAGGVGGRGDCRGVVGASSNETSSTLIGDPQSLGGG